jgi:hypothetical protein
MPSSVYGSFKFNIVPKDILRMNFINQINKPGASINESSSGLVISQSKMVDLAVLSLKFSISSKSYKNSSNGTSGQCNQNIFLVNVTYEAANIGVSMNETKKWMDNIEITCASGDQSEKLANTSLYVPKLLRYKQSYLNMYEFSFESRENVPLSKCQVDLLVNADNNLFELFDKQNNKKSTCCFDLKPKANAYMEIVFNKAIINGTSIVNQTVPVELDAGDTIEVAYSYKNTGNGTTPPFQNSAAVSWSDYAYMHNQSSATLSNLMRDGMLIAMRKQSKIELDCLATSSLYSWRLLTPISLSNSWHVYLVNEFDVLFKPDGLMQSRLSLNIAKRIPCDLMVMNGTLLASNGSSYLSLMAGETIQFSFTVINIGVGRARGRWFDAIYLSKYPTISPLDIKLFTQQRVNELDTNETYTISYELRLPLTLKSGTYFIVYQVDSIHVSNDVNYENNQNYFSFNVREMPSADVYIVQGILNMSLAYSGVDQKRSLKLDWQLNANRAVDAYKCDKFYVAMATNENLIYMSANDIEIDDSNVLGASEIDTCARFSIVEISYQVYRPFSQNRVVNVPQLLAEGSYHGVVRTITSVQESDYSNNRAQSNNTFSVSVDELILNNWLSFDMRPNESRLFKFPTTFEISSFRIELYTESTNAFHDLYARDQKIPDENNYRARSRQSFSFNQTCVVTNARTAVYYILVKPYMPTNKQQNYTAKIMVSRIDEIMLESVYPIELSLLGPTTLKLAGIFVPNLIRVCLKKENQMATTICAEKSKTYRFSGELVYATFDLKKAANESIVRANDTMSIFINELNTNKTVQLVLGQLGNIQLKLTGDRQIYFPNQTSIVKLVMTNKGNTDAQVPFGLVSSYKQKIITTSNIITPFLSNDIANKARDRNQDSKFEPDWFQLKQDYIIKSINGIPANMFIYENIVLFNDDGLGSVLQPGLSASITFEIRPISPTQLGKFGFYFYQYKDNFMHEYLKGKLDNYKLNRITGAAWKVLGELFMKRLSQPSSYTKMTNEFLNLMSEHGIKFYKLDDMIAYHLMRLDGAFLQGDLVQAIDFSIVKDRLNFVRSYSARYSLRTLKYRSFCTGWTDNLHIELVVDKVADIVRLLIANDEYVLSKSSENEYLYVSNEYQVDFGDNRTSNFKALVYSSVFDILYEIDLKLNCPKRIVISQEIVLDLTCDSSGRIREISQAESNKIRFSYSASGCLSTVTKQSNDEGGRTETIVYNYDVYNRLVSASSSTGYSQSITYDTHGNINEIKGDTIRMKYEFNLESNGGLLLSRLQSWNVKNGLALIDCKYVFDDSGWVEMVDQLINSTVRILFDTNGRAIHVNENDIFAGKIGSDKASSRSLVMSNGEIFQTTRFDEQSRLLTITNQQGEDIKLRTLLSNKTYTNLEYTDSNGNKMRRISAQMAESETIAGAKFVDEITYTNGAKESNEVDMAKNEARLTKADGSQLRVKFDNQKRRVYYSHATGDPKKGCTYRYKGNTDMIEAAEGVDPHDSVLIDYDNLNRVSRVRSTDEFSIEYVYDPNNEQIREVRTSDGGYHILYEYDAASGRLSRVIDKLTNKELFKITYPESNTLQVINAQESRQTLNQFKIDVRLNLIKEYYTGPLSKDPSEQSITYEYEYNNKMHNTKIIKRTQKGINYCLLIDN